jgi:hypothetical protein
LLAKAEEAALQQRIATAQRKAEAVPFVESFSVLCAWMNKKVATGEEGDSS